MQIDTAFGIVEAFFPTIPGYLAQADPTKLWAGHYGETLYDFMSWRGHDPA